MVHLGHHIHAGAKLIMTLKLLAVAGVFPVFGQITENTAISVGCAAAVVAVVFKAGRELQQIRDKLKEHDTKFEELRAAGQLDRDLLRAELRPALKSPAPELRPWTEAEPRRYRVLILEDNQQDLFMFKRMLSAAFDVDSAETLAEGCDKMEGTTFDCVLLDLGLPDLCRKTAVSKFLSKNPTALCIAMTGAEGMESIALKQGANAFLAKDAMLEPAYVQRMINHAIIRFNSKPTTC